MSAQNLKLRVLKTAFLRCKKKEIREARDFSWEAKERMIRGLYIAFNEERKKLEGAA